MIAILSQSAYNAIKPVVLPSGVAIGEPLHSIDGRCAMAHGFTDEDIAYLTEHGATMYETTPSDFEVKQDET